MQVVVDGLIYEFWPHGGMARLWTELVPRMCAQESSLQVTLSLATSTHYPWPVHAQIQRRAFLPMHRLFLPRRWWGDTVLDTRALVQSQTLRDCRSALWHPTYYTLPRQWNGPVLITVADLIHERMAHLFTGPLNETLRTQKRRAVLAADCIVCISETTRQELQSLYAVEGKDIRVIPLAPASGFRVLANAGKCPRPTEKPFVLYVGDRSHYKNVSVLLGAFSRWNKRTKVDLVFAGRQWSEAERQTLGELGIMEQVHLITNVDDAQLCVLYNQAAAFVHPSLAEGFGIPVLEAMACGCPIVASHIPSTIEIAGELPFYFDPPEPDDLVTALDCALAEGRGSRRTRTGLEHCRCFSWDETARQTLQVYRDLLR